MARNSPLWSFILWHTVSDALYAEYMTDWSKLRHAYGCASDVPALIAALVPDPHAEIWHEVFGRICHQGSIYSASYAALPLLADVADRWSPQDRLLILDLAAAIVVPEDNRDYREEWLRPYEPVISRFQTLCRESLDSRNWPRSEFICLLKADLAFNGDRLWGKELDRFNGGEFVGNCPNCSVELFLVIGEHGFFTTKDWKWITQPSVVRTAIVPNSGTLPSAAQWMIHRTERVHQTELSTWIKHLFGAGSCPNCGATFGVPDAIAAAQ